MMKRALSGAMALCFASAAHAATSPAPATIAAGDAISSPACEYSVFSPVRVKLRTENGSQGLMAESLPESRLAVYVRAECSAIRDHAEAAAAMPSILEQHIKASGLEQVKTSTEQTKLGLGAHYSGIKKVEPGGGTIRHVGRMIVGKSSLLHVLALDDGTEPESMPAKSFLTSVQTKPAVELANPRGQRLLELSAAQGTILRQEVRMNAILEHCAVRMPDLAPAVAQAQASWEQRNRAIRDKMALLSATTMREAVGERLYSEETSQIRQAAASVRERDLAAMAGAPLDRQRCEASIRSVQSGRSDLSLLSKDASAVIMQFQP